jgi:DNA (cytosine-5)-methyltransferase 1
MKYLSVCSGIEAATSAWHHLGWEPVAFSEIEPFPSAVLKHHYPNVPNWGDMTQYKNWPDATIDLLVGGTPCQSFSVAGLRKGLEDPRGNLMLTFLGIADRYQPRYIVWENVPGVLSSNGGKDFGSFLGALGELGYGWAYRVLDAQWFGVAQRRRRVFVVGCLGDQRRAGEVLFESESVSRNTPPSRAKGQGATADAQGSVGSSSAHAFKVRGGCEGGGKGYLGSDDTAFTVATHQDQNIAQPLPFDTTQLTCPSNYSSPKPGDPCHPLAAGAHIPAVAFKSGQGAASRSIGWNENVSPTLPANAGGNTAPAVIGTMTAMQVRRLTPVECERLQGFPDSWTNIPWRGKAEAPDGPRYKALGNSMAVPVMRWIGERINKQP